MPSAVSAAVMAVADVVACASASAALAGKRGSAAFARSMRATPSAACCATCTSSCASKGEPDVVSPARCPAPNTMCGPTAKARERSAAAARAARGPSCSRTAARPRPSAASKCDRTPGDKASPPDGRGSTADWRSAATTTGHGVCRPVTGGAAGGMALPGGSPATMRRAAWSASASRSAVVVPGRRTPGAPRQRGQAPPQAQPASSAWRVAGAAACGNGLRTGPTAAPPAPQSAGRRADRPAGRAATARAAAAIVSGLSVPNA